jgi:hypothetical protein
LFSDCGAEVVVEFEEPIDVVLCVTAVVRVTELGAEVTDEVTVAVSVTVEAAIVEAGAAVYWTCVPTIPEIARTEVEPANRRRIAKIVRNPINS